MAASKYSRAQLLRILSELPEYPAVLMPVPGGGFEVIFPNLPGSLSYGIKRETALKAGAELLTAEIFIALSQGDPLPKSSDPERLIPDPDEPEGTELVMIRPEVSILAKRLGLEKAKKGEAMRSLGVFGRPKGR